MKKPAILLRIALTAMCLNVAHTIFALPATEVRRFEELGTREGLPDNRVNDICEDRFGFVWAATWHGLARYDGNSMTVFLRDDGDPGTIVSNMVRCLYAAPDGLWVGTDMGIDFYSYATGRFEHCRVSVANLAGVQSLTTRVSRIVGGRAGEIFCLTVGGELLRLDPAADGRVFRVLPKPSDRRYGDICTYTDGRIMALSDRGISVLSPDGERDVAHTPLPYGYDVNMNIYCDTIGGRVYVGRGIGAGSLTFDIVSDDGRLRPAADGISVQGLMRVARSGDTLYFAGDGSGLHRLGPDGELRRCVPDDASAAADALYSLCCTRSGDVWCATYRHGICLLSERLDRHRILRAATGAISYDIVTAALPVGDRIYLGLDGRGLDVYDRRTGSVRNYSGANSALPGDNVVSLVHAGSRLWMAVYSTGVVEMDPEAGTFALHRMPDEHYQKVWALADDGRGGLWVGGSGLHVLDMATGAVETPAGCNNLNVSSIADGGDCMWVSSGVLGVLRIDKRTRSILARYSDRPSPGGVELPSSNASFLALDSRGTLWVTMSDGRLHAIDTHAGTVRAYGPADGLIESRVQSMAEDAGGDLWFGTAAGLYHFIRGRGVFVPSADPRLLTSFTANAAACDGDTMYFGTDSGLLCITGGEKDDFTPPNSNALIFSDLETMNTPRRTISLYTDGRGSEVRLAHDENFFVVSFTVPQSVTPVRRLFEYRLEGLDDEWRRAGSQRRAVYTNVPAGEYRLLVRHTTPDGAWTEPAGLRIAVMPPWYATGWARLLWTVLTLALMAVAYGMWRRMARSREDAHIAELNTRTEREINETKLDFYAKITHELRTPCFLISAQIEEMLDSEREYVTVNDLRGVYRNSVKLNKLINRIIDFRKIDSGHFRLKPREIELCGYFRDLVPDYEHLCRHKSINFDYVHDPAPIDAVFDPDKLELVVTNLISNAYKYTPEGGDVTLAIRDRGDEVAISVSDTGIGIADAQREAIFQPFYRTERGRQQSGGDGIGLAFVKELVDMHGGRIELATRINEGSVFTVHLPKNLTPAAEPAAESRPEVAAPAPEPVDMGIDNPTATRSMLVVDDNPEVIALLTRTFRDDYRVVSAADGAEAIDALECGDFDVVVTDIMMPGLDGHGLIARIKESPRLRSIRIVVFSAVNSEDDIIKAYDAKVDAFITKPASLKVLRRSVDRLFQQEETPVALAPEASPAAPQSKYNREERRFLLECRRIIDETMTDEDFGIEMLASRLAMSHSSLYKKIRRLTGMSLIEFINEYRIFKAVELFRQGNVNVQTVAAQCGFRDIKTFRETFKRKMNMPPKQFITSLRR